MEQHDDDALIIYTDGSMLSRPRRAGGYAFRLITIDEHGHEQYDDYAPEGDLSATNNEMELTACIEALKLVTGRHSPVSADTYSKIVIYVDAMYVYKHLPMAETTWPQRGWMTSKGEPVLNVDLWRELVRLKQKAGRVDFRKVKAHQKGAKKNKHNEAVDELAKESARRAQRRAPGAPLVSRKTTPNSTKPGSVSMDGQTQAIKIITEKHVPRSRPRTTQYKFEVIAPESPDFGQVDEAFAHDGIGLLRRNGCYEVRFASKADRPGRWIEEIVVFPDDDA